MLTVTIPCPDCENEMARRVSPFHNGKGWYCSECDWSFTDEELEALEEADSDDDGYDDFEDE